MIETWGGRVRELLCRRYAGIHGLGMEANRKHNRDKVWDGEEFVASLGAVRRGKKELICLDGPLVTPDHRVMTERG